MPDFAGEPHAPPNTHSIHRRHRSTHDLAGANVGPHFSPMAACRSRSCDADSRHGSPRRNLGGCANPLRRLGAGSPDRLFAGASCARTGDDPDCPRHLRDPRLVREFFCTHHAAGRVRPRLRESFRGREGVGDSDRFRRKRRAHHAEHRDARVPVRRRRSFARQYAEPADPRGRPGRRGQYSSVADARDWRAILDKVDRTECLGRGISATRQRADGRASWWHAQRPMRAGSNPDRRWLNRSRTDDDRSAVQQNAVLL